MSATEDLEGARMDTLERKARVASKRSKITQELLTKHIDDCTKLQKWAFRIGIVTLAWIVTHSPEAAAALATIIKALQ